MPRDVVAFLTVQQSNNTGEIASEYSTFEELFNKKLWHQLTLRVEQFVKNPIFSTGDGLIQLYENFLADFEHRINPLSLVEVCLHVVRQIEVVQGNQAALEFLEKLKEKVKSHPQANILCLTAIGTQHLNESNLETTKTLIEQAQEILDSIDGVTKIHGRFYELASNYHKLKGDHAAYYKDALRFLGCTEIEEIHEDERIGRAFHLGIAALLGDGVYNFGELLAHPILTSLKGSDKQWLVDLLYAFNSGNLEQYEKLKSKWKQQPDLGMDEQRLRQKISLLCLMEMTFKRPANHRQLTFTEIAKEARLPITGVELLVMKALSLGLVKGSIDQVDEKVHMTWVQPRVLDLKQISSMLERLDQWCKDVNSMQILLEDKAQDILT